MTSDSPPGKLESQEYKFYPTNDNGLSFPSTFFIYSITSPSQNRNTDQVSFVNYSQSPITRSHGNMIHKGTEPIKTGSRTISTGEVHYVLSEFIVE